MDHIKKFLIDEVIDGSTFVGWLDLGLDVKIRKKIRLLNVRCHNTKVDSGREAKIFVEQLIKDKDVYCRTFKDRYRKWNTVLGVLYIQSDEGQSINLNDMLVDKSFAISTGDSFRE